MLAKLCFLILSIGVIGATLLSLRQQRTETIHAMAALQRSLPDLDRRLADSQTRVAMHLTPSFVHNMAVALGNLNPVGVDPLTRVPNSPAVAGTTSTRRPAVPENADKRRDPAPTPKNRTTPPQR